MRLYPLWTEKELQILKEFFPRLSLNGIGGPVTKETLLSLLPGKSWDSIKWKARQLDLRRALKLVYPPLNLSSFDRGYITGLVDGEGCISLQRLKRKNGHINYHPYISIANKDLNVLKWVNQTTELGSVRRLKPTPPSERTEKWRQRPWTWSEAYTWQASSNAACYRLLSAIGHHLKIKKKQAELILDFLESQSQKPKAKVIRNPETGYFISKIPIKNTPREEEIYVEIRQLNKRGNSLNHV